MLHEARILYRRYFKRRPYGWSGDYGSWQKAREHGTGYDAAGIVQKVKAAALQVKKGEAVYERDSVLFDKVEYSWPLASALLWVAAKNKSRLHVLDFGGSLGTSYFQNKRFLDTLDEVSWNIVEQDNFVRIGRESIQDERLRFYPEVEESIARHGKPDLLVVACALHYMEKPYGVVERLVGYGIPHIIIDNMPFNFARRDRITLQKVPPIIYTASYPCWFLDYEKVLASFTRKYNVVSEHVNDDRIELDGRSVPYRGFLLELKR